MSDSKKKYEDMLESNQTKVTAHITESIKNLQVIDYEYVNSNEKESRARAIAQNGNDGIHYQDDGMVQYRGFNCAQEELEFFDKHGLFRPKKETLKGDTSPDLVGNPTDKGSGLRYNIGKPRYDLLHPVAQDGIVSVLTAGANKYAPRNWENGMNWSTVLASMKRHIAAIERGEDFDKETGLLHVDHVQCNAHFLSAYYKIFPQGDDRRHKYLELPKIGLDIDEVLADFVGGLMKRFPDTVERAVYWNDYKLQENFKEVINDESFWLELDAKVDSLPFEPHCYITSRPCSTEITEKWLAHKGFPKAKVYTVGLDKSKIDVAKESGIDLFVDDAYHNFVELNKAGVLCYLFNAPHNERYDVGFKRIHNLKELL